MVSPRVRWAAAGLVLLLGGGGVLIAARRQPVSAQPARQAQADALLPQRTKGSATAPLTIYEMSDFQCPYCRRQAVEVLPTIEKEFIATGKVRWIFLNLPIPELHANAVAAAEFAMCAAKVNRFWPVHDLLFTYQDKWAPLKDPGPFLITLADSAGIPRDSLVGCLQNHETRALVQGEAEGAAKSGVSSTPTVYIEGVGMLRGAAPLESWRGILDSLYKEKAGR
ncbi:MAG TPA: thioredoxin domain-containing protein [Gemmatimonadales bacterium]|nr:thioredoxin domain-containing protein [Gemmatimonadales bacterium]